MARRHDILRTTFTANAGQPFQVVRPSVALADLEQAGVFQLLDFTSALHPPAGLQNYLIEEVRRPFNLAQGPLWRVKLLQLGQAEHVLLLTMHHIISDGWSLELFCRELSLLYTAYTHGAASPLAELPIQYADFAQWQQQWLAGEPLEAQLAYWARQRRLAPGAGLTGRPPPLPVANPTRGAVLFYAATRPGPGTQNIEPARGRHPFHDPGSGV
jgi:hypothetical protein